MDVLDAAFFRMEIFKDCIVLVLPCEFRFFLCLFSFFLDPQNQKSDIDRLRNQSRSEVVAAWEHDARAVTSLAPDN